MNYNYHTHTERCHHADGTPEEYILRAAGCGIRYMGFSDHSPFICAGGEQSNYRVRSEEARDYCGEIKNLADKYRDRIDIKVGFEMEYYPENFDKMLENAVSYGAEYLILGQHFLGDESIYPEPSVAPTDDIDSLRMYAELVTAGMKTRKFTYVAHPDIFNFTGDIEVYRTQMRKICVSSVKYKIPLEINFLGIRGKRHYPDCEFLKLAGEEKAPVTFGFDAHEPYDAYDGESLKTALGYVKRYNLNYIGKPELILLSK